MKSYWIGLLLVLAACGTSQSAYQKEVRDRLDLYWVANQEKDYVAMADMIYPGLYDIVTREDMIAAFAQLEEDVQYSMDSMVIDSIGPLVTYDNTRYVSVFYRFTMSMRFLDDTYHEPQVEQSILESFQRQYGPAATVDNHTFIMPVTAHMLAIHTPVTQAWTFMEVKQDQSYLLRQVIPDEALQALQINVEQ